MNLDKILSKILDKNGNISGNKLKFLDEPSKIYIAENTTFLDDTSSLLERLYCLRNNISNYAQCITCGALVTNFVNNAYSKYCTLLCANSSEEVKQKRRATSMENYGVDNPAKSHLVKSSTRESNIEKYGVDNPAKTAQGRQAISEGVTAAFAAEHDSIIERRQITNRAKYGKDSFSQTPLFLEKTTSTNIAKYGSAWRSSTDEWKQNTRNIFTEKYGVDNPFKSDLIKHKIIDANLSKYGVDNPSKSAVIQHKKLETQLDRYGVSYFNQKHITSEALAILGNKDKLLEFCLENPEAYSLLGVNKTTLYRYLTKYEIKDQIVKSQSSAMEIHLSNFISELGFEVILRSRSVIPPLELDIYIPESNLAIECNGAYWHSELRGKDRHYHLMKTNRCKEVNVQLIQIFDFEYIDNPDIVKNRIRAKLNKSVERYYARNTKVVHVAKDQEVDFLNKTHIQHYVRSDYCIGLELDGTLVALMSFCKSRYSAHAEWELLRYASIGNCVGGMSKLFKYFTKDTTVSTVITYSDKRWNSGESYKNLNFTYLHDSSPNYFYTKDYRTMESRLKYQKHKLEKILPVFDKTLTEWHNMKLSGYDRLWDCGNSVYIWKRP